MRDNNIIGSVKPSKIIQTVFEEEKINDYNYMGVIKNIQKSIHGLSY